MKNSNGDLIGSPVNPAIFRIGVDYHINFELNNKYLGSPTSAKWESFSPGIKVEIYSGTTWSDYQGGL